MSDPSVDISTAGKRDNKLDEVSAEKEFQRFLNCMGLEMDPPEDGDDLKSYQEIHRRIIGALCKGSLVINENGEAVFTPQRSDDKTPLTFFEPDGNTLIAQDKRKSNELFARMNSSLAALCKVHASTFVKMKMADLKVCHALVTLFLV